MTTPTTQKATARAARRTSSATRARRLVACACAFVLALGLGLPATPLPARAETTEIDAAPDALQQIIEETAAEYNAATDEVSALGQQIEEAQARIAELEAQIPGQEDQLANSARTLYKLQKDGTPIVAIVLSTQSFGEFLDQCVYLDRIYGNASDKLSRLIALHDELTETEAALEQALADAQSEQIRLEDALAAAQEAREQAQREAEERAAAEAAEAQAALEAAQAAESDDAESGENEGAAEDAETAPDEPAAEPEPPAEETPSEPSDSGNTSGNIDWSTDKQTFVDTWGARIDAYLAGSPLGGYGATFAAAAWDYGVDPRWSPAISNTESSKGLYCFYPHNAWGWGAISWGSWEEAIYAHVAGLARGYGYTITIEAAQKYCPPNWQHWYNVTLAQMNLI